MIYTKINLSSSINAHTDTADKKEQTANFGQRILSCINNMNEGRSEEEKARYAARIYAKVRAGHKLTYKEMDFLARNNPELYRKALRTQAMRSALESRLRSCRSKQEAEEVYLTAVNSIGEKDPDRDMIIAALSEACREFKKSPQYQQLPNNREEEDKEGEGVHYIFNAEGYQETYEETGGISFSVER